jgi:hypothetical protein
MIVYTEKNKKQDYFFAENTLVLYIKRCEKNNFFFGIPTHTIKNN